MKTHGPSSSACLLTSDEKVRCTLTRLSVHQSSPPRTPSQIQASSIFLSSALELTARTSTCSSVLREHLTDLFNATSKWEKRHRALVPLVDIAVCTCVAECVSRGKNASVLDRSDTTQWTRVMEQTHRPISRIFSKFARYLWVLPRVRMVRHYTMRMWQQNARRIDASRRFAVASAAASAGITGAVPPLKELEEEDRCGKRVLEQLKNTRERFLCQHRSKEPRARGQCGERSRCSRYQRLFITLYTSHIDTKSAQPGAPVWALTK